MVMLGFTPRLCLAGPPCRLLPAPRARDSVMSADLTSGGVAQVMLAGSQMPPTLYCSATLGTEARAIAAELPWRSSSCTLATASLFFLTGKKGAASAPSLSTCALTVTRCAFPLLTLLASIPSLLSSGVGAAPHAGSTRCSRWAPGSSGGRRCSWVPEA